MVVSKNLTKDPESIGEYSSRLYSSRWFFPVVRAGLVSVVISGIYH